MINYGSGPGPEEIEVALFGPGFGEAIAVHLGERQWLLVDSCLDPETGDPASATYLQRIGVNAGDVRAIVASHWHDDHVRGLSRLVTAFPRAELQISSTFSDEEAVAFVAAYGSNAAPKLTRGTQELFQALQQRDIVYYVHQRSNVLEAELGETGRTVRVAAMAPVPAAFAVSLARLASYLPVAGANQPIGHAPELRPNLEAVVIHIDWGGDAVLLGADLEEHAAYGWTAVIADAWCSQRKHASAYKVAHHGSSSGDVAQIWKSLLSESPVACLTPFNFGRHRLPTEADRRRIRGVTPHAFITSGATTRPDMESEKLKRLGDICTGLSRVNAGFGMLRLRKRIGDGNWKVELFGSAKHL